MTRANNVDYRIVVLVLLQPCASAPRLALSRLFLSPISLSRWRWPWAVGLCTDNPRRLPSPPLPLATQPTYPTTRYNTAMAEELPYTLFSLGPAQLHQLHTANLVPCPQSPHGKFFVMAEVAQQLFQETPAAFAKDLRAGHYVKMVSDAPAIVATVEALDIPHESGFSGRADAQGIVLLPPETVQRQAKNPPRAAVPPRAAQASEPRGGALHGERTLRGGASHRA